MTKVVKWSPWLLLVTVLLVGLGLRLWGIGFGLPYEFHVDEVQYVRQAASMGSRGLEPAWWNNPPFYKYVYLVEYGLLFVVGRILGWYQSAGDFAARYTVDPTHLYLLSRATTAALGTATIVVTYLLGRNGYGRAIGLLAAWFLSVAFLHVRDSHFATNDVPVTFLVTLALFGGFKIIDTGARRWYVLTGVVIGVGFATKYSAVLVLLPVLAAHFFSLRASAVWRQSWRVTELLFLFLSAAVAAIVASPYFVITPGKVIQDAYSALYVAGQVGFDGWQIDPAGGFVFYLKSLAWGLGWLLFITAMSGIVYTLWRRSPKSWVLLIFVLLTFVMFGRQQMYFARFILPIVPCLVLLAAVVLSWVASGLAKSRRTELMIMAAGALILSVQPLVSSVRLDYVLSQPDTRALAKAWVEENVAAGSKIAVDWPFYGPPLSTQDRPVAKSQNIYDLVAIGGAGLADKPLNWYREQGFDYIITSSFISGIPLLDRAKDEERKAFYAAMAEELEPVKTFTPAVEEHEIPFIFDEIIGPAISLWSRERPGPVLVVYRLK